MYDNDSDSDDSSLSDESEYNENFYLDMVSDNSSDIDSLSSRESEDSVIMELDDFSDDEDDEFIIDQIYYEDVAHLDSEKEDNKLYIGLYKYMPRPKFFLMLNSISSRTFFRYNYYHVLKYLYYHGSVRLHQPKIEIMKLVILPDDTYSVVLKTHWIRLIQRHWRSVLKKRKDIIKGRMNIKSLMWREINGKFPHGLNVFPRLIGMMRHYSK
jgi:hypothetical protein